MHTYRVSPIPCESKQQLQHMPPPHQLWQRMRQAKARCPTCSPAAPSALPSTLHWWGRGQGCIHMQANIVCLDTSSMCMLTGYYACSIHMLHRPHTHTRMHPVLSRDVTALVPNYIAVHAAACYAYGTCITCFAAYASRPSHNCSPFSPLLAECCPNQRETHTVHPSPFGTNHPLSFSATPGFSQKN